MSTKFEQLLDYLVNEEMDKAQDLFHEIVVEKSRSIYENMISEEMEQDEEEDSEEEQQDEGMYDREEAGESVYELANDDDDDDMEPVKKLGGDSADGMVKDTVDPMAMDDSDEGLDDMPDMDDEMEDEDSDVISDDIADIKDAIEELKAEFQSLLAAEKHEEEEEPGIHGGELDDLDVDAEDDEDEEDSEEEEDGKMTKADEEFMREYREVVGKDWHKGGMKEQGHHVGSGSGESMPAPKEGTSPISSGKGKPTSGATAGNIAKSYSETSPDGTSPKTVKGGGLLGTEKGKFTKGELNVDGKTVKGMSKTPAPTKKEAGGTNTKSVESGK